MYTTRGSLLLPAALAAREGRNSRADTPVLWSMTTSLVATPRLALGFSDAGTGGLLSNRSIRPSWYRFRNGEKSKSTSATASSTKFLLACIVRGDVLILSICMCLHLFVVLYVL